jgi:hypothetical protein
VHQFRHRGKVSVVCTGLIWFWFYFILFYLIWWFTQKHVVFFQTYAELAQDLIHINHILQEPAFGDIPLLSSRPQGITPSPAKRRRNSAFTTPPTSTPTTMPIQKRGTSFSSPQANSIMKPVAE